MAWFGKSKATRGAAGPSARDPGVANRDALFDDNFMRTVEHLHMVSRKVFAGSIVAARRTRKVGSGIEFADHRTYTRGDDFRYIDWSLYGRLERLLLRLFEEEEDLHIYLMVDVSDSMAIGSPPKLHYALRVAAALTYVGLANLDRVAIVPFAHQLLGRLAPTRGKNRIFSVFDFLRTCEIGGATNLAACAKQFVAQNKRRGLVVVISDFYDPEGFTAGMNTLRYGRFEPFALQVIEPSEANPQLLGDLTLLDCETGEAKDVTISPSVLAAYKSAHRDYCASLDQFCTSRSIPYFRANTEVAFDELVMTIFRRGGFLR